MTGTVHRIEDTTPVDGPVRIVVIDATGQPRKVYFESMFTRPIASVERRSTYRAIAPTREGDCVQARGPVMADGRLWIEAFVNLDRPPMSP